jgi:hypothetical protein
MSQQGTKPAGRDRGFSTEGFPFVNISIHLLFLAVTQGRVLFIVFIFIVNVVVLLLLLLLSSCALSYQVPLAQSQNVPPPEMHMVVICSSGMF